jgi:hypothetical protein
MWTDFAVPAALECAVSLLWLVMYAVHAAYRMLLYLLQHLKVLFACFGLWVISLGNQLGLWVIRGRMVLEFLSRLWSDVWCAGTLPHTWTTDVAMLGLDH